MTGLPKNEILPEISQAEEWFDLDRSYKAMDWTMEDVIRIAKRDGWTVETVSVIPGTIGYQLKTPDGEYVQFGGTEESVWSKAYARGLFDGIEDE